MPTLNITCGGDKTQVYSEVYDCVTAKKIWYNNFTTAKIYIFLLNVKYMEIKIYQPNLNYTEKEQWTLYCTLTRKHSITNFAYISPSNKDNPSTVWPYFYCCVDPSPLWLLIVFLNRILESGRKDLRLHAPCTFSTSQNLRSERNIQHMLTQLNSTVKSNSSFSHLFALVSSITKPPNVNLQKTFSTLLKSSKTQILLLSKWWYLSKQFKIF